MGQCTTAVKNKVEANNTYGNIKIDYNMAKLLRIIKEIAFKSGDKKYEHQSAFLPWRICWTSDRMTMRAQLPTIKSSSTPWE